MITVAEHVQRIIAGTPFLEEALARGVVNLSALARQLRPQIEKRLTKPVTDAAIVMALRRHAQQLEFSPDELQGVLASLGNLTIRSNLREYTYVRSSSITSCLRDLLQELSGIDDHVLTSTQGAYETTLIVSRDIGAMVERHFADETLVCRLGGLSTITVKLPAISLETPGVHYAILKQLAWRGLNVIEVVSTYTELTIVLDQDDVDAAVSALMGLGTETPRTAGP